MMTGVDDPFLRVFLGECGLDCYESFIAFPESCFAQLIAEIEQHISKIKAAVAKKLKLLCPNFTREYKLTEKNKSDIKEIHQAVHCSCFGDTKLELMLKSDSQN